MKRCPQCNRVETDESLTYCRVDGAALISDSGSVGGDAVTRVGSSSASSEIETSVLPHRSAYARADLIEWMLRQPGLFHSPLPR